MKIDFTSPSSPGLQFMPSDRMATQHGIVGVEQPFVTIEELDERLPPWVPKLDALARLESWPEERLPSSTILYAVFCDKYGWQQGKVKIWITIPDYFRGYLATKVVYEV